jgi:CO/xanthine dehydrogenase FAD-binding subunit
MKPPSFEYYAPSSLDEALALLRDWAPDAKLIAGGQSLVPMMNFRLVHPARLIDLNGIPTLNYIRVEQGELRIGAMTRHSEIEKSPLVRQGWPLFTEALRHVAHVQIRNRGTIGGSLSHADPAAELPAIVTTLDAKLVVRSSTGTRILGADAFFTGALTTLLEPEELLVEVRVPSLPPGTGYAFDELSRRRGDFALVGAAAVLNVDAKGLLSAARLTFIGVGDGPIRSARAETLLIGQKPDADAFAAAAKAAAADLMPESDLHASADYRRHVAEVMARRVLQQAAKRIGMKNDVA